MDHIDRSERSVRNVPFHLQKFSFPVPLLCQLSNMAEADYFECSVCKFAAPDLTVLLMHQCSTSSGTWLDEKVIFCGIPNDCSRWMAWPFSHYIFLRFSSLHVHVVDDVGAIELSGTSEEMIPATSWLVAQLERWEDKHVPLLIECYHKFKHLFGPTWQMERDRNGNFRPKFPEFFGKW